MSVVEASGAGYARSGTDEGWRPIAVEAHAQVVAHHGRRPIPAGDYVLVWRAGWPQAVLFRAGGSRWTNVAYTAPVAVVPG